MRVNSPIMSVDARGAFGPGVVFGKYCGTNVARTRIRTPIRRSAEEQLTKDLLAMSARAWGDLSEEKREAWNDYALTVTRTDSMGQSYHVTGICEFNGRYGLRVRMGLEPLEDPPVLGACPGFYSVEMTVSYYGGAKLTPVWYPRPGDFFVEVMISGPKNNAEKFYANECSLRFFVSSVWAAYPYWIKLHNKAFGWQIRGISIEGVQGPWWTGVIKVI